MSLEQKPFGVLMSGDETLLHVRLLLYDHHIFIKRLKTSLFAMTAQEGQSLDCAIFKGQIFTHMG